MNTPTWFTRRKEASNDANTDALKSCPSSLAVRCEITWNACYPDRRKWADIGESAQAEWLRVFAHFDRIKVEIE